MIVETMNSLVNPDPDETVAVYLSGGIDSSVVLYHIMQKTQNVVALTLDFGTETEEVNKAKAVADYFHVEHRTVHVESFLTILKLVQPLFSRPRWNIWPYYLAKETSRLGIHHAYIGEGSDEIFGYPDRGYLEGWAGQLVYVRHTFDTLNSSFNITTHAPFTDLHHDLVARYGWHMPLMFYNPPMKSHLRDAYDDILPAFILHAPSTPPAITSYKAFGARWGIKGDRNIKQSLQLLATRFWLEVHDVQATND